jgi:hypothetical protein
MKACFTIFISPLHFQAELWEWLKPILVRLQINVNIMGIIILPFIIAALIAFIISVIIIVKNIRKAEMPVQAYFIGIIISAVIYSIIFLNYKCSTSAWIAGTYFAFPVFMILVPFAMGIIARGFTNDTLKSLSSCLLISVICSGIIITIFSKYTFGLIDYLNLPTYH